jgi:UDPglucose 6-dehydrogenase
LGGFDRADGMKKAVGMDEMMTDQEGLPKLSVIGLGKLGSPMAAVFAAKGYRVVGLDLNPAFVGALNNGEAPVAEPRLQQMIEAGRANLRATTDYDDAVKNSDVSFIIVPTPSAADGFFSNKFVIEAVEAIGRALRAKPGYHLVAVTSTVMPGSTGGEIQKALEQASGRPVGDRLGLCYNPEFIALGSVVNDMLLPDMILIGESDEKAGEILEHIYRRSTESNPHIARMNLVNAELCKISVNTYVTTKISYANMIADMCDHLPGADAAVVTHAVGADSRIGRKYLRGAIGYGGPCFPRDNKAFAALGRRLGVNCDLAEATDGINEHQIQRLLGAIEATVQAGARVAVLGMSYKPMTPVIEESQGVKLAGLLAGMDYRVTIADPMAGPAAKAVLGAAVDLAPSAASAVKAADVVVVTVPWPEFADLPAEVFERPEGKLVVIDPWGLYGATPVHAKVQLVSLGRGDWKPGTKRKERAA